MTVMLNDGPDAILRALYEAVSRFVPSDAEATGDPGRRAEQLAKAASLKAAAFSGTLALPAGPAGLLTIIPDLLMVWRLQGRMVADIAAVYGKTAILTREGMLHCLFKHAAAHALAGIVVRTGGSLLIRKASSGVLRSALGKVGLALSERLASRSVTRWLPVVGAAGAGAYAYYDTSRVARTAIEVFASDVRLESA